MITEEVSERDRRVEAVTMRYIRRTKEIVFVELSPEFVFTKREAIRRGG